MHCCCELTLALARLSCKSLLSGLLAQTVTTGGSDSKPESWAKPIIVLINPP